jgi:GT2 family glycosyltransferase
MDHDGAVLPLTAMAIVVTFNSGQYIAQCLASLVGSLPDLQIVVVDNASSDGTVDLVRDLFPQVVLIETGNNLGYAGGNNVGLRYAQANHYDVALIANPDCTFGESCVATLVATLRGHPDIAAACPVIFRGDGRTLWYAGADLDLRRGSTPHVTELPVPLPGSDIVITKRAYGCAMMIRLSAIETVGLFDERYFLYYEEAEWCARCELAQLSVVVVPRAVACHDMGHGAADTSSTYHYYMTRNRLMLVRQYSGHALVALPSCLRTSLQNLASIKRRSWRQAMAQLGSMIKGYSDFARGRMGRQAVTFSWWPVRDEPATT